MNIFFRDTHERSFGTFPLKGAELHDAIQHAAEVGYRAFDTAQMYDNEADTGSALKATGVPRDKLCITTKVNNANFAPERFLDSVEQSLKSLQTDYVDVLLLHWPPADGNIAPPLKLLEQAQKRGLTRNIGVSNFTARMMRDTVNILDTPVVTNQVEFHPLLNQDILLAAATETGIPLASYCSIARGEIFKHPEFAQIAETYGVSAAQVALRWILQKGVTLNTMSTKRANIAANFDVMGFTLSSVDMAAIDSKTQTGYRIVTKDVVPFAPDFD